jgi:hypothetical protein
MCEEREGEREIEREKADQGKKVAEEKLCRLRYMYNYRTNKCNNMHHCVTK